jgi:hypothetical protein
MDFIYVAAPALMTFLFAFLAVNKEKGILRDLFFFLSLLSLIVFVRVAQTAAVYGEVMPDTILTNYSFNATGTLVNSSAVANYTHVSPVSDTDYDYVWLIVSAMVYLVGFLSLLNLLVAMFNGLMATVGWKVKL